MIGVHKLRILNGVHCGISGQKVSFGKVNAFLLLGKHIKIYLSNDNGYTYGHINEDTINLGTYIEGNGVEIENR